MYDSGHRVFISTAGSGSGFDISIEQVVVAARAVSEALSEKADAWIYVGCVAGLEQCLEVANGVRGLKNVKGLLILPNRHPHGDPKGDGTGGPGYTLKAEFNKRKHLRGTVAMARSQSPDSAGSQFYICFAPAPHLDNNYTIFGQVTSGMDVVDRLKVGDKMKSVKIEEPKP